MGEAARLRVVEDTERSVATGDLPDHIRWFARKLRRENKAPRTIQSYVQAAEYLVEFLAGHELPTDAAQLRQAHIEAYLDFLINDRQVKVATVANRFRSLQQFCKYLAEDEDSGVEASPMAKMRPPAVPVQPVPVISDADFATLIRSVRASAKAPSRNGAHWTAFEAKRDEAILRLFADTGMRLAELVDLTVDCVDFEADQAHVLGKGRRFRLCPFDDDTAVALRKYLRERDRHEKRGIRFVNHDDPNDPRNGAPALWIGPKGRMTTSGVAQMLARRSLAALGQRLHPHQIRHTAAHASAASGMSETDMMRNFGWKSDSMPKRYGASAADERAREAKRKLGLGNRFKV